MVGLVGPARGLGADAPKTLARAFARLAWPAYVVLLVTGVWNVTAVGYSSMDSTWKAVLLAKIAVVVLAGLGVMLHQRATTKQGLAIWGPSEAWPAWSRWSWASCWPGDSEYPATHVGHRRSGDARCEEPRAGNGSNLEPSSPLFRPR